MEIRGWLRFQNSDDFRVQCDKELSIRIVLGSIIGRKVNSKHLVKQDFLIPDAE